MANVIFVKIDIELVLGPVSRLLPVGRDATFTCQFRNVHENNHRPFWKVNQTEASNEYNRDKLVKRGFTVLDNQEDSNRITTLTLTVNGSFAGINNTNIQCRTLASVHSQPATILTISGNYELSSC